MKKMILTGAALMMILAAGNVTANTNKTAMEVVAEGEKVQIKPEELPEAVRKALEADEYKGWEIKSAYEVKSEPVTYELQVVKEDETKTLAFSADGKAL